MGRLFDYAKIKRISAISVRITPEFRKLLNFIAENHKRFRLGPSPTKVAWELLIRASMKTLEDTNDFPKADLLRIEQTIRRSSNKEKL